MRTADDRAPRAPESPGPAFLTLTVGGAGVAVSYWFGWDIGALLAVEALAGFGLALSDGEPDDEISSL
ncbi:hypothetical protein [Dactylosporangium sp. NPDC049140]|jgi:hypothetical protein|uniref:hypothetical protein n=1 Tax=unclassified Dactylosporangium TaxID=2621675 RepID=UPI0033D0BC1E